MPRRFPWAHPLRLPGNGAWHTAFSGAAIEELPVPPHAVTGVITLVQESRFELEDRAGRRRLFILSHHAPLEPADLHWLQRAEIPVTVACSQAQGLIASIAHDLAPADDW